jgi:hypothetical protein
MNIYEKFYEWISPIYKSTFKSPWENKFIDYREQLIKYFCDKNKIKEDLFYDVLETIPKEIIAFVVQLLFEFFIEQSFMPDNINIIESYVRRFKYRLPREAIAYLKELRNNAYSIYEITDIKQGEYIKLKNLLINSDEISVIDDMSSDNREIGDKILTKIITYKNENYFSDVQVNFADDVAPFQNNITQMLKNTKNATEIDILRSQYEELWSTLLLPIYEKAKDIIDGNDVSSQRMVFAITKPKKDIVKLLNNLQHKGVTRAPQNNDLWFFVQNLDKLLDDNCEDVKILAEIRFEDNKMIFESVIDGALQELYETIKDDIKGYTKFPVFENVGYDNEDNEPELTREEELEIIRAFFDKYLIDVLREKIPALHDKTPLESIKSEPKVFYEWLDDFIENVETQTENTYNYTWFLENLGADKSRYLR